MLSRISHLIAEMYAFTRFYSCEIELFFNKIRNGHGVTEVPDSIHISIQVSF